MGRLTAICHRRPVLGASNAIVAGGGRFIACKSTNGEHDKGEGESQQRPSDAKRQSSSSQRQGWTEGECEGEGESEREPERSTSQAQGSAGVASCMPQQPR